MSNDYRVWYADEVVDIANSVDGHFQATGHEEYRVDTEGGEDNWVIFAVCEENDCSWSHQIGTKVE